MINVLLNAYEEGEIQPDEKGDLKPEMLYPFSLSQIVGIYTHMKWIGDGVWIRLNDGTVWNAYDECESSDPDGSIFETVEN